MANTDAGHYDGQTDTIQKEKLSEPNRYRVLMHNDDYTTMDFVVAVLRSIFNKNPEEAEALMRVIHNEGVGQCGIYTEEIAEAKVHLVRHEARLAGFPLQCSMEKI